MNNAGFVNRDGEHCRTDSYPLIALPIVTPPVCLVLRVVFIGIDKKLTSSDCCSMLFEKHQSRT